MAGAKAVRKGNLSQMVSLTSDANTEVQHLHDYVITHMPSFIPPLGPPLFPTVTHVFYD